MVLYLNPPYDFETDQVNNQRHWSVGVQADGTRESTVQASCSLGCAAQATPAHERLRVAGLDPLAGDAGK